MDGGDTQSSGRQVLRTKTQIPRYWLVLVIGTQQLASNSYYLASLQASGSMSLIRA